MNPESYSRFASGGRFLGDLLFVEAGRKIGVRQLAHDSKGARQGIGAVEGAVFGLLGLLLAFTFSGAATCFDVRRQLVVEEAKDPGTAWQRLDLLPPAAFSNLQGLLRQYLDSRLETYRKLPDLRAAESEQARSIELQNQIWANAVAACRDSGLSPANLLLLPALNAMFDIATTRIGATRMHPPSVIFGMLALLSLASSLLAGYGMAGGQGAELDAHFRVCRRDGHHLLCDPGDRVSAAWFHPGGWGRSGARGTAAQYELNGRLFHAWSAK